MAYDVTKQPAEWVSAEARRREWRVWTLIAAALILMSSIVWVSLGLRQSAIAVALLVLMFSLARVIDRQGVIAVNWIRGAHSEAAVGEELNGLAGVGYTVMHDLEQAYEGNIDHLVSGPSGVYLIETKHRRYKPEQLTKAKRQAAKLHDEVGLGDTCDLSRSAAPTCSVSTRGRMDRGP